MEATRVTATLEGRDDFSDAIAHASAALSVFLGAMNATAVAMVAFGNRGSAVADVENAFTRMARKVGQSQDDILAALQRGTYGTVAAFDLMKTANRAMSSDFQASSDDWETLAASAKMISDRIGGDMADSLDSITRAMTTGRTMQLRYLGVMVDAKEAVEQYRVTTGKLTGTLTDAERIAALQAQTLKVLRQQLTESGASSADFGDRLSRVWTLMKDFKDEASKATATSKLMNDGMELAGDTLEKLLAKFKELPDAVKIAVTVLTSFTATFVGSLATLYMVNREAGGAAIAGLKRLGLAAADLSAKFMELPHVAQIAGKGITVGLIAVTYAATYEATKAIVGLGDSIRGIERVQPKLGVYDLLKEAPKLVVEFVSNLDKMKGLVGFAFDYNPITLWVKELALAGSAVQSFADRLARMAYGVKDTAGFTTEQLAAIRESHERMAQYQTGTSTSGGAAAEVYSTEVQKALAASILEVSRARAQGLPDLQRELELIRLNCEEQIRNINLMDESQSAKNALIGKAQELAAIQAAQARIQHELVKTTQLTTEAFNVERAALELIEDPFERQIVNIGLALREKEDMLKLNRSLTPSEKELFLDAAKRAAEMAETVARVNEQQRLMGLIGRQTGAEIGRSFADMQRAMELVTGTADDFGKLADDELAKVVEQLRAAAVAARAAGEEVPELSAALTAAFQELEKRTPLDETLVDPLERFLNMKVENWGDVVTQFKGVFEFGDEQDKLKLMGQSIGYVTNVLGDLGIAADSAFGKLISGVEGFASAMASGNPIAILTQVATVSADIAKTAFESGSVSKGAIAGVKGGPIGIMAGAAIGGISGALGLAKSEEEKAANAANEAREAWVKATGGADDFNAAMVQMHKVAAEAGVSLDTLFNAKRVEDVEEYTQQFEELVGLQGQLKDLAAETWGNVVSGTQAWSAGMEILSPEDAAMQAQIAMMSFSEVVKREGLLAAGEAFAPIAEKFQTAMAELGLGGDLDTLLGPMFSAVGAAGNEAFVQIVDSASALADTVEGLRANGLPMTRAQFDALSASAQQFVQRSLEAGVTEEQAYLGAYDLLAQLNAASAQYGYGLDENTQRLLGQAQAIGGAFQVDPINQLTSAINNLTLTLGGSVEPALGSAKVRFQEVGETASQSIGMISDQFLTTVSSMENSINIMGDNMDYTRIQTSTMAGMMVDSIGGVTGAVGGLAGSFGAVVDGALAASEAIRNIGGPDSSISVDDVDIPHFQHGGVVHEPTLGIFGEAGPEAIVPLEQMGRFGGSDGSGDTRAVMNEFVRVITRSFRDALFQARAGV